MKLISDVLKCRFVIYAWWIYFESLNMDLYCTLLFFETSQCFSYLILMPPGPHTSSNLVRQRGVRELILQKKGFWLVWNVTESSAGRVCERWCPTERSNNLLLQFHGKKKHAHLLGWPSAQWKRNQINTITEHADHICQTELSHKEPMSQLVLCWQSVEAELKYSFPFKFILTCLQLQL